MGILGWLIIGGLAGAIAGRFVSGHGYGILMDIVVGIVGAFIGGWLFGLLFHVAIGDFSLITFLAALVGSVVLLMLVRLVTGQRARV